jgi:hypothetical protein
MPSMVTDGVMSADGRYALLRSYTEVFLYDARTWKLVRSHKTPSQPQGESIAIEPPGRSFRIGSEGANSALIRMPLTLPKSTATPSATPTPTNKKAGTKGTAAARDDGGFSGWIWLWAVGGVALVAAIASAGSRRA